ncbi:MAG: hypothetical protein CVV41_13390 [Candidatus Riflebacteria bacterium HGW-Riflebacteria-1]|jgi:prepilin-type N-terminal cleavage/methylation domain-containing protein|nr:MAG: hypothetical protein CVV41_13390 [Candidatus Riflebacteria bacterium HGW-Riflebacteria-1]
MAKSRSCQAEGSVNSAIKGSRLHKRSLYSETPRNVAGFTLIEVLIVVLVMGVLFGTGLSVYSGVTRDSQLRTRTDELTSFFAACRHRAMLRKTPLNILFTNGYLGTDKAPNLRQRLSEVDSAFASQLFNGIYVGTDGKFTRNGSVVNKLHLPVKLPGGHISVLTIEL